MAVVSYFFGSFFNLTLFLFDSFSGSFHSPVIRDTYRKYYMWASRASAHSKDMSRPYNWGPVLFGAYGAACIQEETKTHPPPPPSHPSLSPSGTNTRCRRLHTFLWEFCFWKLTAKEKTYEGTVRVNVDVSQLRHFTSMQQYSSSPFAIPVWGAFSLHGLISRRLLEP